MHNPEPLAPGDWVEYRPRSVGSDYQDRIGALGHVVTLDGGKAIVRFEDGVELKLWQSNLAWMSSQEQIAEDGAQLQREHLRYMRSIDGPRTVEPGCPEVHLDADAFHDCDGA